CSRHGCGAARSGRCWPAIPRRAWPFWPGSASTCTPPARTRPSTPRASCPATWRSAFSRELRTGRWPMPGEALRLRVDVPAAPGGYDVVCGPGVLPALPGLLDEIGAAGRALVLSDTTVASLHGERVMTLLGAAGWDALLWAMPAGEAHKTL